MEVGFYSTATLSRRNAVTNVALWNEFGTDGKNGVGAIPERPFFRLSIIKMQAPILKLLIAEVDPRTMVVTREIAEKIGLLVQGIIQRQIVLLRDPPNSPVYHWHARDHQTR